MAKKKMPTQRTLERLRDLGHTAGVVERFQSHAGPFGIRIDLFGCIDIIALVNGQIVGVQATSYTNHSAHVKKALEQENLVKWLQCGGRFEIWSWKKTTPKGTKLVRWEPRIEEIKLPTHTPENREQIQLI
jgi:hypothetical protein